MAAALVFWTLLGVGLFLLWREVWRRLRRIDRKTLREAAKLFQMAQRRPILFVACILAAILPVLGALLARGLVVWFTGPR